MKLFQSIRWRIQLWHSLILAIVVVSMGALFYHFEKQSLMTSVDLELRGKLPLILPRFSDPPRGRPGGDFGGARRRGPPRDDAREDRPRRPRRDGSGSDDPELKEAFSDDGFFYALWFRGGRPPHFSENAPPGLTPIADVTGRGGSILHTRGGNREAYDATPSLECLIVGVPLAEIGQKLDALAWRITSYCAVFFAGAVFIGWLITGVVVRPFHTIREVSRRVANGELGARIPEQKTAGEIRLLTSDLNETFSQLDRSFDHQKKFTADAAHELRSPIAAICTQIQVALRHERSPEEYRATLEACQRNSDHLRQLANHLLDLSELDSGNRSLDKASTDLCDIIRTALDHLQPQLDTHRADLQLDLTPAPCQADPVRLAQVITNLVNNALQHSPDGVRIEIRCGIENGQPTATITDNGPGIPADSLGHVFERFHRVSESRDHRHGTTGLGLAIAKAIVDQHGGTLALDSTEGQGTSVSLTLPA